MSLNQSVIDAFTDQYNAYTAKYGSKITTMNTKVINDLVDINTASNNDIWNTLWDKCVRANARFDKAEYRVNQAKPLLNNAWSKMSKLPNDFTVERIGKTMDPNDYKIQGSTAQKIYKEIGIASHRLYMIHNAGHSFAKRVNEHGHPFTELKNHSLAQFIYNDHLRKFILQIDKEFKEYFSKITTCHFLTDIGYGAKPDIHLMRSLINIGAWHGKDTLNSGKQCAEAIKIVADLTTAIYGSLTPQNLRRMDIELMGMSLNKDTWQF